MENADRLLELFDQARNLRYGPEREHFLAESCADDPDLKEQVVSSIQAAESPGDFLRDTLVPPNLSPSENVGDR